MKLYPLKCFFFKFKFKVNFRPRKTEKKVQVGLQIGLVSNWLPMHKLVVEISLFKSRL